MIVSDLVLEKAYEVKYYEQNLKNELKESSLLNFLQDAATVSAETSVSGRLLCFQIILRGLCSNIILSSQNQSKTPIP